MKWTSALMLGAILAFVLPLAFGGTGGVWRHSWAGYGTIAPFDRSPGLLFSIPLFIGTSIAARMFFNWHRS
ncbi:hypothetical protein [Sphingomicrobium nitratireducens]|uniref:hypothetical protein n=1 Tax=Sphingomicrobium nitratireducens TaxID=2964666 RepID=UPI00223F422C|nr:hypothetical protein [Sphingomicrobium nitratireducens]